MGVGLGSGGVISSCGAVIGVETEVLVGYYETVRRVKGEGCLYRQRCGGHSIPSGGFLPRQASLSI